MESMKGQKTLPEGFLALSQSRGQQVQPPPPGMNRGGFPPDQSVSVQADNSALQ